MGLTQYVDEPMLETVPRPLPSVVLEPVLKPLSWSKDPFVSLKGRRLRTFRTAHGGFKAGPIAGKQQICRSAAVAPRQTAAP